MRINTFTSRHNRCAFFQVSGNASKTVLEHVEASKDNVLYVMSTAGLKNPSAQHTSGDKTTDVDVAPSVSSPTSAVHITHPSVNNQEDASGFNDDRHSAPTVHEEFKPVKLRTNGWLRKHKVSMKNFIMKRAVRKSDDLETSNNFGISQGNMDVSSLVRQAVKRGRDVVLKHAKMATDHKGKLYFPRIAKRRYLRGALDQNFTHVFGFGSFG